MAKSLATIAEPYVTTGRFALRPAKAGDSYFLDCLRRVFSVPFSTITPAAAQFNHLRIDCARRWFWIGGFMIRDLSLLSEAGVGVCLR
jgi:hypothetical protein